MAKLKDAEHLLRLAALFAAGFVLFVVLRTVAIPKSFGKYGHYRADALQDIMARPIAFAGHKACEDCHGDVVAVKKAGKHAGVNCEICHGPLAKHVEDPASVVPELPDTGVICARCHEMELARPKTFPQVNTKEHSSGEKCKTCHQPHSPLLQPGGGK